MQIVSPSEINDNDVLCGRGAFANTHIGNRRFRELVASYQEVYLSAKMWRKRDISTFIVDAIKRREPGGRFLKRETTDCISVSSTTDDENSGQKPIQVVWRVIDDRAAKDKTSQALREKAPEVRKRMSISGTMQTNTCLDVPSMDGLILHAPDAVTSTTPPNKTSAHDDGATHVVSLQASPLRHSFSKSSRQSLSDGDFMDILDAAATPRQNDDFPRVITVTKRGTKCADSGEERNPTTSTSDHSDLDTSDFTTKATKHHHRHFVQHNYHDHARDNEDEIVDNFATIVTEGHENEESCTRRKRRKCRNRNRLKTSFPQKLHKMLEEAEQDVSSSVVSWQPHGRAFMVHNVKEFTDNIMPKYFRHGKKSSFQRQLNLYGFLRITQGPDTGAYYHELFLRGKYFLTQKMVRTTIKGTGCKASSNPQTEPDFYNMPPVMAASCIDREDKQEIVTNAEKGSVWSKAKEERSNITAQTVASREGRCEPSCADNIDFDHTIKGHNINVRAAGVVHRDVVPYQEHTAQVLHDCNAKLGDSTNAKSVTCCSTSNASVQKELSDGDAAAFQGSTFHYLACIDTTTPTQRSQRDAFNGSRIFRGIEEETAVFLQSDACESDLSEAEEEDGDEACSCDFELLKLILDD